MSGTLTRLTGFLPAEISMVTIVPLGTVVSLATDWLMTLPCATDSLYELDVSTASPAPPRASRASFSDLFTTSGTFTCSLPKLVLYETTGQSPFWKSSTLMSTDVPGAGVCSHTLPGSTSSEFTVPSLSGNKVAAMSAVSASSCPIPLRSGTTMDVGIGRPFAMVMSTFEPSSTDASASGLWLRISPS